MQKLIKICSNDSTLGTVYYFISTLYPSVILPMLNYPVIYLLMPYIHNPEVHGRFYGIVIKREMVVLEKAWSFEENDCRFEVQRDDDLDTRPTWSIPARERLLAIFCD